MVVDPARCIVAHSANHKWHPNCKRVDCAFATEKLRSVVGKEEYQGRFIWAALCRMDYK